MTLYKKIVITAVSLLVITIGSVSVLYVRTMQQLWFTAVSLYTRTSLHDYIEGYPKRLVQLLEDSGFLGIDSFEESYRKEAYSAIGEIHNLPDFIAGESMESLRILIYDNRRTAIVGRKAISEFPWIVPFFEQPELPSEGEGSRQGCYFSYAYFDYWDWYVIACIPNTYLVDTVSLVVRNTVMIGIFIWLILAVILNLLLQKILLQPLAKVENKTMELVSRGYEIEVPSGIKGVFDRLLYVVDVAGQLLGEQRQELFNEIEQRKKAQHDLQDLVDEKERLVREIHHRVKNNLSMIYSTIDLEQRRISSDEQREILNVIQRRVRTMGLIHEQLYRSKGMETVDSAAYFSSLVEYLRNSFSFKNGQHIQISAEVEEHQMNYTAARTCGLIINELITNAISHAYPEKSEGHIQVSFRKESGESYCLRVSDDGTGIKEPANTGEKSSMGVILINGFAAQLSGEVVYERKNGTVCTVRFPSGGSEA